MSMSEEKIVQSLTELLEQAISKVGIFGMAVIGSFIVLIDAYTVKKQTLLDSFFTSMVAFLLGFGTGWITSYATENKSVMLTVALIACLSSKSLVSYFMNETKIHIDTLIKGIIKYFTPKK